MIGFDHAFRTLLLKKIRGLTNEGLLKYEGLLALQRELIQDYEVIKFECGYEQQWPGNRAQCQTEKDWRNYVDGEKRKRLDRLKKQIQGAGTLAHKTIEPYKDQFNELHGLWIARRQLALQQGNYFQGPFSTHFGCHLLTWFAYWPKLMRAWLIFPSVRFEKRAHSLKERCASSRRLLPKYYLVALSAFLFRRIFSGVILFEKLPQWLLMKLCGSSRRQFQDKK